GRGTAGRRAPRLAEVPGRRQHRAGARRQRRQRGVPQLHVHRRYVEPGVPAGAAGRAWTGGDRPRDTAATEAPRARAIHGAGDREGQTGAGRGVRAAWAAGRITEGAFEPTEWPLLDLLPPEERRRLNELRRLFDALLLGARHSQLAPTVPQWNLRRPA